MFVLGPDDFLDYTVKAAQKGIDLQNTGMIEVATSKFINVRSDRDIFEILDIPESQR